MKDKIQQIQQVMQSNLLSIAKYSVLDKEVLILVLQKVDYIQLAGLKKILAKDDFVVFQQDDLVAGKDIFALDFVNIKANQECLFGEDYFSEMKVDKNHLRHQLEFELRNKMINLRENFVKYNLDDNILLAVKQFFYRVAIGLVHLDDLKIDISDLKLAEIWEKITKEYSLQAEWEELIDLFMGSNYLQVEVLSDCLQEICRVVDENIAS